MLSCVRLILQFSDRDDYDDRDMDMDVDQDCDSSCCKCLTKELEWNPFNLMKL